MPSVLLDGVASRLFSSRRLQNRFQIRYRWQGAKRPARVAPRRGAQNASLRVCRTPSSMAGSVENNHIAGAFLNGIHRRLAI